MRRKNGLCVLIVIMLISLCACGNVETARQTDVESSTQAEPTKQIMIADYPMYDTAQNLVDAADLVFTGKVENITYEMLDIKMESGPDSITGLEEASSVPYTIFEIKVSNVYKGNVTDETIYLKRPGGNFDTIVYELEGATPINQGEEYLFVAQTFENFYPSLVNVDQAVYDLNAPEVLSEDNTITLSQILSLFE
ncbi:hypothetical protein NDGK_01933 [Clostridiales bacterium CHKCI001]|nr:hypothetical protein NDGK_01933 [Clostridiales bacterium CHKCI001]